MFRRSLTIAKQSIYTRLNRLLFNIECRGILKTKPIYSKDERVVVISILSHKDVLMYLIAAKSFYHHLKSGAFVLINDGTLSDVDKRLIAKHIVGIKIVNASDINKNNPNCPKGGTWERLLYASDVNNENYCIVLDADTITIGDIPEVRECIAKNVPFIMLGSSKDSIKGMKSYWEELAPKIKIEDFYSKWDFQQNFDHGLNRIPNFTSLKYVKGSSGFHGQSRQDFPRKRLEEFSIQMKAVFHERWNDWSSEQSTVCVLVSNVENSVALPFEKYAVHWNESNMNYHNCSFLHFIGPCRFVGRRYQKLSKDFIKKMKRLE